MKKIYFLACAFMLSVTVNAATKTWVGGASGEWWYANNWSPLGLPGPTDEIRISGATVYIYSPAMAQNVALFQAKLVIGMGGELHIPKELAGFDQAIFIFNGSTLDVTGQLIIGGNATANFPTGINIASDSGNVIVRYNGKITIDRCQTALYTYGGPISNDGNIEIGQQGTITSRGIYLEKGILENKDYGTILIDNVQGPAISTSTYTASTGWRTINNSGLIRIGDIGNVTGSGIKASDVDLFNGGSIFVDGAANGIELTRGILHTNPTSGIIIGDNTAVTGSGIVTTNTIIDNSGAIILKRSQGDGMNLNGGSFTNYTRLRIGHWPQGAGNVGSGNCGGIGIHASGTVISNTNTIDFGIVGGNGMQLENSSSFTNSGTIAGGNPWTYTGMTTAIAGNMMVLDHSTFINTGTYNANNSTYNMVPIGIVLNNTSHVDNSGTLKMTGPRTGFSVDGNSDIKNSGFLEAYYGLIKGLYVAGGSTFENKTGGSVHFGATLTNGQALVTVTGSGSKLINRSAMVVNYGYDRGIEILQQARLQNEAGSLIQVDQVQDNGIELSGQSQVDNHGTIELMNITEIPLHVSNASMIINIGMVKVGNGANNTKTGILLEGSDTRFENNAAGEITINKTAAGYNGTLVTTGAVFQNDGKISWGTSGAFQGSAALQLLNNGVFDNRMASATLEFVNCTNDAIVCDVSPTGSSLFLSGSVKFGNIGGRGIYNSDPNFGIINAAHFETMPSGKMNLQVGISQGIAGSLVNADGTVTLGLNFSNNGTVSNGGTLTQSGSFFNAGLAVNNGTWNNSGTFNNNNNGICKGTGTFQGSVFKNNIGTVAPGNSPGCIKFASGFTSQSTARLDIEVNGKTTACTQFDRLNITGTATLSGALNVTFGGGYTPVAGDKITILKSTSLTGTFSSNNLPAGWSILYNQPATGDVTLAYLTALPLTLLDFNVKKDGDKAKTSWTTTNEINTAYFELERSSTGNQFQRLATILAMNTPGDHHYESVDAFPLAGRNYYRLRMVDKDGKYTYSPMMSLNMDKVSSVISAIYPNPAKDIVHIAVTGNSNDLSIQIISPDGKTVLSKQLATRGIHELNVSMLPAGIYFIKASYGETYRLIINRR